MVSKYIFDPEISAGKMIFLLGPRQVGKTTFAKNWLDSSGQEGTYFDWDDPAVRREYLKNPLYFKNIINENYRQNPVPMVFDEIHKHRNWKNILKGVYDPQREKVRMLVTGSARLSPFRKAGDSLAGRYFSFQMFPLGLPEALQDFSRVLKDDRNLSQGELFISEAKKAGPKTAGENLERLLNFGGFPEPFLRSSPRFHRRWQREYHTLLVKEDVRDLSRIIDLKGLEHLVTLLPPRVGSPLSINSLREDLSYHHRTIVNWLEILKELYLVFTIKPWHKNIIRSLKKEPKLYFFDWSLLPDPGPRLENLLAVTLLRMAARFTDTGLGVYEIMYIRDKEKHEVDFTLVKDGKPVALFEVQESDSEISKSGRYFGKRLGIPFYQITRRLDKAEEYPENCFKIPAVNFLMLTG